MTSADLPKIGIGLFQYIVGESLFSIKWVNLYLAQMHGSRIRVKQIIELEIIQINLCIRAVQLKFSRFA